MTKLIKLGCALTAVFALCGERNVFAVDDEALTLIQTDRKDQLGEQEESSEGNEAPPLQQEVKGYSSPNAEAAENDFVRLLRKPEEYANKDNLFRNRVYLQLKPFLNTVEAQDGSGKLVNIHSRMSASLATGWSYQWDDSWNTTVEYEFKHSDWRPISSLEPSFLPGATNTHRLGIDMAWQLHQAFAFLGGLSIEELLFVNSSQGSTISWVTEWEAAFSFGFLSRLYHGKTGSFFAQALVKILPPINSPPQDSIEANLGENLRIYFVHRVGTRWQLSEGLWLDMQSRNTKNVKASVFTAGLDLSLSFGSLIH